LTFETLTAVMVPNNRIMLVDDEDGIRDLLCELLVDSGFEIVAGDDRRRGVPAASPRKPATAPD
jgi:hypothetical protein